MHTESLKGKVALVTGGAGGIGRATCLALAAEGAAVAVMDIDLAGGESVAEELQDLGATAGAFATDVSDYDATKSALARIRESLGEPLIVVCNAGIAGEPVLFRSEDKANWQRLFQVHVDGAYHCIRETINPMLAAGWGRIVCISSVAAQMGWRGGGFLRRRQRGADRAGTHVGLGICRQGRHRQCGTARRDRYRHDARGAESRVGACGGDHSHGPHRAAQDIAQAVAYLCSHRGGYLTGQLISPNGGMWLP